MSEARSNQSGDRKILQLERCIRHSVDRVWQAVTDPAQLGRWYPLTVRSLEPEVGGAITFDDGEGTVYRGQIKELAPPRRFAFTEENDRINIELQPDGDGCWLIFTHYFDDPDIAGSVEKGWNECLDELNALLAE